MSWVAFDQGTTIGQHGSEHGIITRDEEHELGARITLERAGAVAPFAITCGIYGWMFHTRFFGTEPEAAAEFERMKVSLVAILRIIPHKDDPQANAKSCLVAEAISAFVERFP